jgi:AraC-like DNA-binding protein
VKPDEVQFSHQAPENVSGYARLLNVPVRFNQHQSCLILDAEAMRMPLPRHDPEARKRILADIEKIVLEDPPDVSTLTRRALSQVLYLDKPTLSEVASEMGLHPRALERRLAEEGQTFGALRDKVRFAVASELLELTDIPVDETAPEPTAAFEALLPLPPHLVEVGLEEPVEGRRTGISGPVAGRAALSLTLGVSCSVDGPPQRDPDEVASQERNRRRRRGRSPAGS